MALQVIFCLFTSPKFDFGEVEKSMFLVVARHSKLVSYSLPAENAKAMFQRVACSLNSFSASWPNRNATWVRSKKRCFKVSHGTLNLFWTCGLAQNAIWMRPKKRCFKVPNGFLNLIWAFGLAENSIWWSRKCDDSSCQMSVWTNFLLLDLPKMLLFSTW